MTYGETRMNILCGAYLRCASLLPTRREVTDRNYGTVSIECFPSCSTLLCSRTVHSKAPALASCCTCQGDVLPAVALLKAHFGVQRVVCSVQPIQELELELIRPQIPDGTEANAAKCFDRSRTLYGPEHVELLVRTASMWHKGGKHGASFVAMSRFLIYFGAEVRV